MSTITAIIPTFNEAMHVNDVIASLKWCDRIIVIDSFSADETASLAAAAGAEVVQRAYQGPAEQKNHAITLAKSDWVIILDADERVTPELQSEIEAIIQQDHPAHQAYWIGRRNHFLGKEVKYSGWQSDKVIRLFKRGQCVYGKQMVHEEMECSCSVGMLSHKLLHYTYRDMPHYLEKFDRYTTWSAQDRLAHTGKVTLYHLWVKPIFRFFRHYVLRGGILDGKVGFIISVMSGYSVFLRYLKIERLQKGESL